MDPRLAAAGDVVLLRHLADDASVEPSLCRHLRAADWSIANLEVPLVTQVSPQPWGMRSLRGAVDLAEDLSRTGLLAVSLANNHSSDQGWQGLVSTQAACGDPGIEVCGVGDHAEHALEPLIVPAARWSGGKSELDLAVIAVTCVGHPDMLAIERPGVAGLRVATSYEIDTERVHEQPGWPARVVTTPRPGEVERLTDAVARAQRLTPLVLVVLHWGVTLQESLAEYQRIIGRALAEAGVTAIFGHQAHVLQGVEWIGSTPIFYGLGSLTFHYDGDISAHVSDDSAVALVDVDARTGLATRAQLVIGRLNEHGEPVEAEASRAEVIASRISRLSHELEGVVVFGEDSRLSITPGATTLATEGR